LGVAVAAGAAAAFAYTRSGVYSALAGIAIAVALVPPLCAAGIILAMGSDSSPEIGLEVEIYDPEGPLILYLTNFIGIVFAGSTVFFLQYHKRRLIAVITIMVTLCCLALLTYPLGFRMKNLLIRNQIRRNLTVIARDILPQNTNVRLRNMTVIVEPETIYIRVNILAPPGLINKEFIDKFKHRLSELVDRQIVMEFGVIIEQVMHSTRDAPILMQGKGPP
jgi:hypothetical protein